jgi:hypothetical protein
MEAGADRSMTAQSNPAGIERRPTIDEIVAETAMRYGVPRCAITAGGRAESSYVSRVRAEAVNRVVDTYPALRYKTVARRFGLHANVVWKIKDMHGKREPLAPMVDPTVALKEFALNRQIRVGDIVGRKRGKDIDGVRSDAMREVARRCPSLSTTDLGRLFDRHHATILHALGRVSRNKAGISCSLK